MSKKYYVYCAYGINDEVLYIGKGSGNRYQHCSSGASANRDLNRYYFTNGEEGSITVKIRTEEKGFFKSYKTKDW